MGLRVAGSRWAHPLALGLLVPWELEAGGRTRAVQGVGSRGRPVPPAPLAHMYPGEAAERGAQFQGDQEALSMTTHKTGKPQPVSPLDVGPEAAASPELQVTLSLSHGLGPWLEREGLTG